MPRLRAALAGRYTIERELGRGGMAIVYLARDLKHDRPVAVKVLRPEVAGALGPERFLREIEIAARLNHPHILPLHDSGEADGFLYYVMPVVEGESLRQRLTREGQLSLEDTLQITREVGSALSYAHTHAVIHRDIKPENILLSGGVALVADFGIARAISSASGDQLTSTGVSVGTPSYMSPEQALGQASLDGRSDQYSLGCVVYEMLAGAPPFTGPTAQAVVARHLMDPVPPLRTVRGAVPQPVEQAVLRALSKALADRFPEIGAFLDALTRTTTPRSRRKTIAIAVAGTLAILAIGYAVSLWRRSLELPARSVERSIAVLPFRNIGGDSSNDYFGAGMSEELVASLSKIPDLSVAASPQRVSAQFRKGELDVRGIGRQLAVAYVIDGGVRKAGHRLRVSAQLISATDGHVPWSEEYERDDHDVFAVQDELSGAIVRALQVKLIGATALPTGRRGTNNPEAYDLYLQGRYFYAKRDSVSLRKARGYFELAIRKDSNYALAYDGLSDVYSHSTVFGYAAPGEVYPRAKAAALRALALDSTLVEVHTSLGFIALFLEMDWSTAQRELDRALALNPRYAEAHLFHGWYFLTRNRMDDAVAEVRTAVRLDPFSIISNIRLASMLYYARRYDEALAQVRRVQELEPTFFQIPFELSHTELKLGHCDAAVAALARVPEYAEFPNFGNSGWVKARCGQRAAALAELDRLRSEVREGRFVSYFAFAAIHAGLGDTERAFTELDSAYAQRTWAILTLKVEPAFDEMRTDPRFARFLKQVGLP